MQIPLELLRRHLKMRSNFVLGVVGLASHDSLAARSSSRSQMKNFCEKLAEKIELELHHSVSRFAPYEEVDPILQDRISNQDRNAKYKLLGILASWRQERVAVVDLSMLHIEMLTAIACQCDGLVGVLGTPSKEAVNLVQSVQASGGKWIGYWQIPRVALVSSLSHNSDSSIR